MTNHLVSGETETDLSLDELANEFKIIQSGSKRISIFGTRNLSITHQQVVETIACALTQAGNTIITSGGASGVNFAAIEGALKGDPTKLEVILPQTINEQSPEVQEKLKEVRHIAEHKDRVDMDFAEASRICYNEIVDSAHQLICFLYHDSNTLAKAVEHAKFNHKIVTVFYLD